MRDCRFRLIFIAATPYQKCRLAAMTDAKRCLLFEGPTPLLAAYSVSAIQSQAARHSQAAICAIQSPNSSSTADQTSADVKFAN